MKMKTTLLLICSIIFYSNCQAQKEKIKGNKFTYSYAVYPEIDGYQDTKTFTMDASVNGVKYSYSEGNTEEAKRADLYNPMGLAYKFSQRLSDADLKIEIDQTSSSPHDKIVVHYKDQATKTTRFSYKISANQVYSMKVYDMKNGGKLLKEVIIETSVLTHWPGVPSSTVGYGSKEALQENYTKKSETVRGFNKKINSALFLSSLYSGARPELIMLLHDSQEKIYSKTISIKSKGKDFSGLETAKEYLDLGFDLIKENDKLKIKGNHHVKNAQEYFALAHEIYLDFNKEEHINWFTDQKKQNEYSLGILRSLYFTSFLISDFESCDNLIAEIGNMKDGASEDVIEDIKDMLDEMKKIRKFQEREERLQSVFETRFTY